MAEVVRAFLSPLEIAELVALADRGSWLAGRQGTGYENLPLRDVLVAHPVVERAIALLGTPLDDQWDVYLLRYLDGAHVPDHVDPARPGTRHRRINAILTPPTRGGELRIDGALVELSVGDAVVFDPDRERHEVSPVIGTRIVFSVGALL